MYRHILIFTISLLLSLNAEPLGKSQANESLKEKLKMVIPSFEIETHNFTFSLIALRQEVAFMDTTGVGINIIYIPKFKPVVSFEEQFKEIKESDPFKEPNEVKKEKKKNQKIILKGKAVSQIIEMICKSTNKKYRIDKNAVVIMDEVINSTKFKQWDKDFLAQKIATLKKNPSPMKGEVKLFEKILENEPQKKENIALTQALKIILPRVSLGNCELNPALDFIRRQVAYISQGKLNIDLEVAKLSKSSASLFNANKISIEANNISVEDLLNYIGEQQKLVLEYIDGKVIITDEEQAEYINKKYPISPGLLTFVEDNDQNFNSKNILELLGVNFSKQARIKFPKQGMVFIIYQTEANHRKIEKIFNTFKSSK
jgi:hypothetical protein